MGKGDKRRPAQVPKDEFRANWDRIFGRPGDGTHCRKCGAESCRGVDIDDGGLCNSCKEE